MEQNILWASLTNTGLEHLRLSQNEEHIIADGLIIGIQDHRPFRLRYEIRCDTQWRVRSAHLSVDDPPHTLQLHSNGKGTWTAKTGDPLPAFDGCFDIDISVTPFTNTLPIRRTGLKTGETCDLTVVYITAPDLQIEPLQQRYTCLNTTLDSATYRYESPSSEFTADLSVDADGLVLFYPELFKRVQI